MSSQTAPQATDSSPQQDQLHVATSEREEATTAPAPEPTFSPKQIDSSNASHSRLFKSHSSPSANTIAGRRSSSVPPSQRRSYNRRASTSSIPTSSVTAGRNKLKNILASDANSIVDLYEKRRVSLGASSVVGGMEASRRSSIGRLSLGSTVSADPTEAGIGRSLDARRARKVAHEQAVLLENRVSRLQKLEELYRKRIEQTTKQTNLIKENKERHQKDLIQKYKQKLQKREKVEKLKRTNAKKADQRRRSVRDARLKCLMEKRQKVQAEKRERQMRKKQKQEEELNQVRQKRERINKMSKKRQNLRVKRKQSFYNQMQEKYHQNSEHIAFEAQLRSKLNERSDVMCDKELQMIERLKQLEAQQQKAVKDLKRVLS